MVRLVAVVYVSQGRAAGRVEQLLRYEQWNIDEQSVVSFAGLAFSAS